MLVKKKSRKASIIKPLCAVYYCNNPTEIGITSCWFVWDCSVIEFTFFISIYNTLLNLHCVLCTTLLFFCCSMSVHSVNRERCHCFLSGHWAPLLKAVSSLSPSPPPLPCCWAAAGRGSALLAPVPICAAENLSESCKGRPRLLRLMTSWHLLP